jgi:hypothetical protein
MERLCNEEATMSNENVVAADNAAPPPVGTEVTLPRGSSFHRFMTNPGGLKAALDRDETRPFTVVAQDGFRGAAAQFDPPVVQRIVDLFALGQPGLDAFLGDVAGRTLDPGSFARDPAVREALRTRLKKPENLPLDVVMVMPLVVLTSGGGVRVRIDDRNRYANVGYRPGGDGPDHAADPKSGRSFMTSPIHGARDTSDLAYLKDLDSYLGAADADAAAFFRALLELITRCDAEGYARLSDLGQSVVTDFVGVYTAELDRNLMSAVHQWENDLAEVTFLSAFGCAARRVNKGGSLTEGVPADYFGIGPHGSGIGETRPYRRALQQAVCAAARGISPGATGDLEGLVGAPSDGDLFHGLMQFINDPAKQEVVEGDGSRLVDVTVAMLTWTRDHASEITAWIEQHGLPAAVFHGAPPATS